jgi:mono/diheme cytochrome c family protein
MLKPSLLISAAMLLIAAPIYIAAQNPVKPTAESHAKAKKLYSIDCAVCHGDNGDGKTDTARDLKVALVDYTDPNTLAGKKDQELFDIIRKGKGKMPAEEVGRAKDEDAWALIHYIRSFSKGQAATPQPADAPKTDAEPSADAPK